MAFLLGLTGNIACGKSTVGRLLTERYAAEYLDADAVVHALYAAGTPQTQAIAARFGAHLLQTDGTLDRRRLGDVVLADRAALRELEAILDPGVRAAINTRLSQTTAEVLVLDAIRLIEGGLYRRCDAVWVVLCARDLQHARLEASRGLTPEQAALRIDAQVPAETRLAHATAVLRNDGSLVDLAVQVAAAWEQTVAPKLGAQRVQANPP